MDSLENQVRNLYVGYKYNLGVQSTTAKILIVQFDSLLLLFDIHLQMEIPENLIIILFLDLWMKKFQT
jgi:hypothetical protein